ncbi:MAG TPA: DUF4260 family protein [Candidatus Saccharimonadales bacterium]|jgi:hypothetical protein|nr:DUF4260 family protein [Candidatus Saccharimonadales bacterium]
MSPRAVHVLEYALLAVAFAGAAYVQRDQLGVLFWVLLVGPDIGLVVAPALGPMPGRGRLPPRAVPIYNAFHTYTVPVLLWIGAWATSIGPWPLLGWLIHISADRALGFGLRGPDGDQALI